MSQQRARALVIVESPTKAKTISKFLGPDYHVVASLGHIRDLPSSASEIPSALKKKPWARIGVNVEEGFEPLYVIPSDKKKHIQELKALLSEVDELYIATDEDREGESIGWHLIEVLKPKVPTKRMVFHEITKDAILKALNATRPLNEALVRAQETRRVLDRLVGYMVSPLLWKKVAPRLSAGRVQSAAVKLLVERERLRMSFVSAEWWDLKASVSAENTPFEATLTRVAGELVATGAQFDPNTGELKLGKEHTLLDQARAHALVSAVGAPSEATLTVSSIERKHSKKAPPPPFITSTLQQEANRAYGWSASQTMKVAQRLYEQGFITYMRTDAPALASEAVEGIRRAIKERFGEGSLPEKPKVYSAKSKGAQEAHEAIRPSGTEMLDAHALGLTDQEARLYSLIWRRTMACQMTSAELSHTTVTLTLESGEGPLELRASGREVRAPGYFAVYESKDATESPLPQLTEGQTLTLESLSAEEHHTRPPARFNEASLVKALESEGVGRPSTYASIIETIQRRGYVRSSGRQLAPTFTALAVTQLLERAFSEVVDLEFTAAMEGWLDEVTTAEQQQERLQSFYDEQLLKGMSRGEELDPREICAIHGPHFEGFEVRVGRFGPFIEYTKGEGDDAERATISLPDEVNPDEVNEAWIKAQLAQAEAGERPLGYALTEGGERGEAIYAKTGRYGPYVQLGEGDKPKRVSLPQGLTPMSVSLEQARHLISLPLTLGQDDQEREIKLGLGRFGPYVQVGRLYASLKPTDDLFDLPFERALELIKEKETSGGKGKRSAEPLKLLGEHPDGGAVELFEGRYGPYVKHGKVNASLPKDASVESLTLEEALELIAKRAAQPKKAKRSTRKKS